MTRRARLAGRESAAENVPLHPDERPQTPRWRELVWWIGELAEDAHSFSASRVERGEQSVDLKIPYSVVDRLVRTRRVGRKRWHAERHLPLLEVEAETGPSGRQVEERSEQAEQVDQSLGA